MCGEFVPKLQGITCTFT